MPIPSQTAFDRISRSVNYTESLRRNRDTVESPLVPSNRDLRWVSLSGDVHGSTTSTGYLCNWSVASSAYAVSTQQVTVVDTTSRFYGLKNQWVLCRGNYQSSTPHGIYEIVWAPNVFDFELSGNISPGGSAAAYRLNASGTADTSDPTITLYDLPEGNRRARQRDDDQFPRRAGQGSLEHGPDDTAVGDCGVCPAGTVHYGGLYEQLHAEHCRGDDFHRHQSEGARPRPGSQQSDDAGHRVALQYQEIIHPRFRQRAAT